MREGKGINTGKKEVRQYCLYRFFFLGDMFLQLNYPTDGTENSSNS